jgi:diguanylate cyclase (GGDEF)-like protein
MGSSIQQNLVQRTRDREASSPRADIQVELTRLLFRKLGGTVLIGGAGFVGTTALLAKHYADPWLWALTAFMAVVCTARLIVVIAFSIRHNRSDSPLTPYTASLWEFTYGFFTFFYCCALAASTFYNFHHHDGTAQLLCTMGTYSLCASLGARIGMRPWIVQQCSMVMLTSLAISVGHSNELLARTGLVIVFLFAYANWEGAANKFQILTEQLRSKRTLQHLADQDPLTGLANRRHFEETLATLCTQPRTFGILYMDLDRFKQVNDTHGHLVGDALLKRVAHRLRQVVRCDDLLARLGGDEFAIIQTQIADEDSPQHLAARIHKALAKPIMIEGHEIRISASIGARITEGVPTTPRILLGCADAALYRVKQAGGASFALAED